MHTHYHFENPIFRTPWNTVSHPQLGPPALEDQEKRETGCLSHCSINIRAHTVIFNKRHCLMFNRQNRLFSINSLILKGQAWRKAQIQSLEKALHEPTVVVMAVHGSYIL